MARKKNSKKKEQLIPARASGPHNAVIPSGYTVTFKTFSVPAGQKIKKDLLSSKRGICYLAGFAGKFEGGREFVYLDIVDNRWILRAGTNQIEFSVRVAVLKYSN